MGTKSREVVILNATREGYSVGQIGGTMTVGELIEALSTFDEDAKVYFGNDPQHSYNGWYTYGGIGDGDVIGGWYDDEEDESEFDCDTSRM